MTNSRTSKKTKKTNAKNKAKVNKQIPFDRAVKTPMITREHCACPEDCTGTAHPEIPAPVSTMGPHTSADGLPERVTVTGVLPVRVGRSNIIYNGIVFRDPVTPSVINQPIPVDKHLVYKIIKGLIGLNPIWLVTNNVHLVIEVMLQIYGTHALEQFMIGDASTAFDRMQAMLQWLIEHMNISANLVARSMARQHDEDLRNLTPREVDAWRAVHGGRRRVRFGNQALTRQEADDLWRNKTENGVCELECANRINARNLLGHQVLSACTVTGRPGSFVPGRKVDSAVDAF